VDWQSWRLVFFVNLLIGIPALLPARRLLRESREPQSALPDALGVVLLTAGVGAVTLAIVQGPDWGWDSTRVIGALAASVLLLLLFVRRSGRHRAPVIELALFRVRSFAVANTGGFVFALGFYALLLSNVLFLTGVWGYSVVKAGVALTPGPLMAALAAPIGGRLSDRFGQRVVAVPGGLVFAAGALLFALRVGEERSYAADFLPATLLTGTGVGLTFAALASAAVAELPRSRFATGSAINTTFRQLGAALGIAALIAVLGTSAAVDDYRRAWALIALTGGVTALSALALGRVRARHVAEPAGLSLAETEP
jgi:MFS family permease